MAVRNLIIELKENINMLKDIPKVKSLIKLNKDKYLKIYENLKMNI